MQPNETSWGINESLLQSYRSIFISSQSVLLAAGAFLTDTDAASFVAIAGLSLVQVWFIWFPAVRARHRIVDFHKFGRLLDQTKFAQLCKEDEYVHSATLRREANKMFPIKTNWRRSRIKIDLLTPLFFTLMWAVMLVYVVIGA